MINNSPICLEAVTTFVSVKRRAVSHFPADGRPSDHQSAFRRCRRPTPAGGVFARRPLRGERRKRKRRTDGHTGEEGRKRRGGEASSAPTTAPSDTQRRRRESTNQPRKESSVYPISPHSRPLARSTTSLGATDRRADRSTYALRFPPSTYNRVRARRTSLGDFIR